ncbi:unnamed protein product, partial [Ectocarpus sp. 6 AP-2014]
MAQGILSLLGKTHCCCHERVPEQSPFRDCRNKSVVLMLLWCSVLHPVYMRLQYLRFSVCEVGTMNKVRLEWPERWQ